MLTAGFLTLLLMFQEIESPPSAAAPGDDWTFAGVVDGTPVEYEDRAAYFGLLNKASQQPLQTLREEAGQFVSGQRTGSKFSQLPEDQYPLFYEMLTRPDDFRGQPVLLRGHVLKVDSYDAGDNPYGIKTLYEAWVVTEDSQNHPCTVVFLDPPQGLPARGEIREQVEVVGYFLKVYTYPALDHKTRKAPLVLAKSLQITPPPRLETTTGSILIVAIVWGTILGIAALVFLNWRSRREIHKVRARLLSEPDPDFSKLRDEGT